MNCSTCQERLDERLDLLRARVQDGSVSRADVRAQGVAALQDVVGDCSECESELRTHLNVRLALLGNEPETISVPPELLLNVRRALEREKLVPQRTASRRSWMGFAWTGGSVFLALGLFMIARPLLIEQAQKTVAPASNQAPSSAEPESSLLPGTPPSASLKQKKSPSPSLPLAQQKVPSKPRGAVPPQAQAMITPRQKRGRQSQQPAEPQTASNPVTSPGGPPPPVASPKAPTQPVQNPTSSASNSTSTITSVAPQAKAAEPKHKQNVQDPLRLSTPPAAAPPLLDKASTSTPQATALPGASKVKPRVATPDAQSYAKSTVTREEDLGLEAHFVTERSNRFMARGGFGGGGFGGANGFGGNASGGGNGGGFGGNNSNPANDATNNTSAVPASPGPVSSSEQRARAAEDRANSSSDVPRGQNARKSPGNARSSVPPPGKRSGSPATNNTSPALGLNGARNNEGVISNAGEVNNARLQQKNRVFNASDAPPFISISVISPVINARITGRIKEKNEEAILLWAGDLGARQPVNISLAPLGVAAKDEVEISVEQQISPEQTKKLATTTLIAP